VSTDANYFLFRVLTPLGFTVHCSWHYWEMKIVGDHPVMAGREADVIRALTDPNEIRLSQIDREVFLFYAPDDKRLVCAVARRTDSDGFLITAYPADRVKKGEIVWTK